MVISGQNATKINFKEELSFYRPDKKFIDFNKVSENLPRAPEKFKLLGYCKPITSITFHPVYSVFASSSEDGSIRLWDYENGNLEKVLRAMQQQSTVSHLSPIPMNY